MFLKFTNKIYFFVRFLSWKRKKSSFVRYIVTRRRKKLPTANSEMRGTPRDVSRNRANSARVIINEMAPDTSLYERGSIMPLGHLVNSSIIRGRCVIIYAHFVDICIDSNNLRSAQEEGYGKSEKNGRGMRSREK